MTRILTLTTTQKFPSKGTAANNVKDASAHLKSAFYLGFFLNQLPGGMLAERWGGYRVFGVSMAGCALLCSAIPLAAGYLSGRTLVGVLYAVRLVQGLLAAVTFPSLMVLATKWSPLSEKNKFITCLWAGCTFGICVTYAMCGLIMEYLSWTWVFYTTRDGNF